MLRGLSGSDILDGGAGWWFEFEREIILGDRLLVPDLAGWRAEVEPEFVDENPITVRPDWVCEILSRSTQRSDRVVKLPVYAEAGVGHAWIVDPEARSVEVFATIDAKPTLVASAIGDVKRALPPFADEIDFAGAWGKRK